ncbi:MAG: ABC transporter permease subunit/CPBP intramembrane protease [Planctomycetota bacterium]
MTRLTRINTIWRKELSDTLRDRRTLIAMILVPLVLYPAMMLGSLQGFELQVSKLKQEEYRVGVLSEADRANLRRLLDSDPARQPQTEGLPAEKLVEMAKEGEFERQPQTQPAPRDRSASEAARADVRRQPPPYYVEVVGDPATLQQAVVAGFVHAGLIASQWPEPDGSGSAQFTLLVDQTDIRSQIAAAGLEGVLERAGDWLLVERLRRVQLEPEFIQPVEVREAPVATPEKVGGSILGQIVPLILVIMTITGAIYPAIDLTAGERERGTLETLMVAPVPTVDLIAGKFVVVALIAMISASLNLLSIGGTIYLGGLGSLLTQGSEVVIPLTALPWVLLVLIPLAVMFSAVLLAVCSFARSFKEAQNYVMPVMIAALIPAVVGILPGMRLNGPLLIMPVTNIVILTRDLFTGRTDLHAFAWVMLSTTLYAGAAVAVAAKLFGQEAVLFADSGSIRTLLKRRFFRPAERPTTAQAFLLLAVVFSLNFFAQQWVQAQREALGTLGFWYAFAAILVMFFVLLPAGMALYLRLRIRTSFALAPPRGRALFAALCFGLSTWVLAQAWMTYQRTWLPMPPEMERLMEELEAGLFAGSPLLIVVFLALTPALCEELFFRGFALSGLRGGLGGALAVAVVAVAFGVYHFSVHRLIITAGLGVVLGLLVLRFGSVWPAVLTHFMHNGISALAAHPEGLQPWLARLGYPSDAPGGPPAAWLAGALVLIAVGLAVCLRGAGQRGITAAVGGFSTEAPERTHSEPSTLHKAPGG